MRIEHQSREDLGHSIYIVTEIRALDPDDPMPENFSIGEDYAYPAQLLRVVDGDTWDLQTLHKRTVRDLGQSSTGERRVIVTSFVRHVRHRLKDLDTPETYGVKKDTAEYQRGVAATQFVVQWFEANTKVTAVTYKDREGKYGRYLTDVVVDGTGETLSSALREAGHEK